MRTRKKCWALVKFVENLDNTEHLDTNQINAIHYFTSLSSTVKCYAWEFEFLSLKELSK